MSAPSSPSQTLSTPGAPASDATAPAEIDASCRVPLLVAFSGAAFWLLVSSGFALIASLKFHSPNFLADRAWLTYGRVHPAALNALVYGFGIQAGLGVGLWLMARLARARLAWPWLIGVGAKLWSLGVFAGLLGILAGDGTGFEWLEMPRYAAVILFPAYLLVAGCVIATFQRRHEQTLYPSQCFILAALFWFPWIYSTASLLLFVFPVRGMVQASIAWWYSGNLLVVWLALVGLATTFYFLPKLTERPLHSHYTALFVFWTLILFGTWAGIPNGAPLPAWMPALSTVATVLTLVPVLAVAVIAIQTVRGAKTTGAGGPLCYIKFGTGSFVVSSVLLAVSAVPPISNVTDFTWFSAGVTQWRLYGFFAMTMFGAIYYILPRVVGMELPFAKLIRVHFWLGMAGTLLLAVPLTIGGVVQGLKLLDPAIAPVDLAKSTLMFLRVSTVGDTLIAFGNLLFLLNVTATLVRYYVGVLKTALAAATVRLEPAEAKP